MLVQRMARFIPVVIVAGFITACSSSGTMTIKQPLSQKIPSGKTVSLSVSIAQEHQQEEDFKEVAKRIREGLYSKLVTEGIFKAVLLTPEPTDYGMDVTITSARMVSGAARVMLGVMAGHNDAQLAVKVINREGNHLIADYEVDGTSASHPFSSESRPDDAIREAINQVVAGLR